MEKIELVNANLLKRGFKSCIVANAEQAKQKALSIIGKGSVGFGGSVTINEIGLYDALIANGNEVFWHWKGGSDMRKKAMFANYYVCSANALTEDGCPVLIDGSGNRVAALSFGPDNAVLIIGKNKIVDDLSSAIARIKSGECSGKNGIRLGFKTPCAVSGKCADCNMPQRMCSVTAIYERPSKGLQNVYVILVDCNLGY
jgi:L-lactate utilization protein LutC